MYMKLDVNTDVYPIKENEKFVVLLTSTLNKDGSAVSEYYTQANTRQNGGGFTGGNGHTAWGDGQMAPMITSPDTVVDSLWYTDSGATDHCTPDNNNLMRQADYLSKKRIYIGNVGGLNINSIGYNTFVHDKHTFLLKNILHIHISQQIYSVSLNL
ncbi:hypothetical protein LWI28_021458 [Acer negundo]|uniref:Retrovirus-related Pol polyprotein from transposon TNT 1-94-like beta-barrel domain-containing protein n=1 Tax=Acer negundo TaxID=4023 RepID=A0AAD5JM71_ACENE|nr:hypothetical protein LWI28_021458 [Acer negundo]